MRAGEEMRTPLGPAQMRLLPLQRERKEFQGASLWNGWKHIPERVPNEEKGLSQEDVHPLRGLQRLLSK